ncbi:hypothetical protein NEOLI_002463 [Neolecta irregularis DAH-3]|uniref:Programmed cell death protein 5 n=1 Tax=Neolecta irregularis (strain DAH-3) TaxID=1198029 RepID=A0A1U7LJ56_NEOID|nr:hypothetical protein NEOLI_002463 [Neolecta irregularis DAH-3]|eukprot:OLL22658.1 hypothetical protein NEOLI_002463 [Neolecta irregularis DAH-3]
MDDSELKAIREARLRQLQQQNQHSAQNNATGAGNAPAPGEKSQEEEARRAILSQIFMPESRERLSRISIVKPERARAVEDLIIQSAQQGRLRSRVSEKELIDLLDQISKQESNKREAKIVYTRRTIADENEDDDELFE